MTPAPEPPPKGCLASLSGDGLHWFPNSLPPDAKPNVTFDIGIM